MLDSVPKFSELTPIIRILRVSCMFQSSITLLDEVSNLQNEPESMFRMSLDNSLWGQLVKNSGNLPFQDGESTCRVFLREDFNNVTVQEGSGKRLFINLVDVPLPVALRLEQRFPENDSDANKMISGGEVLIIRPVNMTVPGVDVIKKAGCGALLRSGDFIHPLVPALRLEH